MKKLFGIIAAGVLFAGCGKVEHYSNDYGSAIFLNAVPFTPPAAGSVAVSMRVYEQDTIPRSASNIAYRGTSGYLAFAPGTRSVDMRSSFDFTTKFVEARDQVFEFNKASTFVAYDTVNDASGRAKMVRLNDTLTVPDNNFVKLRFLHLAVNAPAVDVTLVRTSATPNDSITFFNRSYIGDPTADDVLSLSTFTTIPLGTYSVRMKAAGTQTLVFPATTLTTANLAGTAAMKGICTLFAAGTAKTLPLSLGILRHYP